MFQWTNEVKEAFNDLKKYLTSPPTWVAPKPHENLQLYISTTSNMISTVIAVERGESGYQSQDPVPDVLHQRSAE
jgi:hypothetical protein